MEAGPDCTPTSLGQDSQLYPDQSLLFILAHAFGSNNDLPTALRVVGHVSQKFSIPITTAVWAELLECAYTLSTKRYKKRKFDGAQLGQLAPQTVEDLFTVLTSEPHNCKPTMTMLDRLVCSLRRRDYLPLTVHYISEGLKLHHDAEQRYLEYLRNLPWELSYEQEEELLKLRENKFVSSIIVSQWFRLLSCGERWLWYNCLLWERQLLPDVIEIFWRYRNFDGVSYKMDTGLVHLQDVG